MDTAGRTGAGLNFSPPPNICQPAAFLKQMPAEVESIKIYGNNRLQQLGANPQFPGLTGGQHKKGQIWCQLKELLDPNSYLISQNIKILVSDWRVGKVGGTGRKGLDSTRSYFIVHNWS